jgi:hypothetical protein
MPPTHRWAQTPIFPGGLHVSGEIIHFGLASICAALSVSCAAADSSSDLSTHEGRASQADSAATPAVRLGPDPMISPGDDHYIQPSVAINDSGFAIVSYERSDPAKQAIGWAASGNWTSGSPVWTVVIRRAPAGQR